MRFVQNIAARSGIFYGWFTLVGVMLIVFTVGGSFVNSFGVMLPVICEKFGWSRASVSVGLSIGVIAFGLPSPLFGMLVSKFGARFAFILGNILAAMGIAGMSLIQQVWHIYILYLFIGLGAGFGGYITSATVVNNWFIEKRSLAMGLFVASMGLGGFVFPPVVTVLIGLVGWRMTWLVLAGVAVLVSVLLSSIILIRNTPEELGLQPDGKKADIPTDIKFQTRFSGKSEAAVPIGRVLAMSTTWLIGFFIVANAFASGTLSTHQVAYLKDLGFTPITAATTISVMAAFNAFGSLSYGILAMRLHVRTLAVAAFILQLAAFGILLFVPKNMFVVYLFAGFIGLSAGALTAAMPTFVGMCFNRKMYSRVLGVIFPFQLISMAVAGILAGVIYDAAGTYTPAFAIAMVMSFSGLVCVAMIRTPKPI